MPKLSDKSTRTILPTDIAYAMSTDGTQDGKVPFQDFTVIPETTRTINFNNTMSAATMQGMIDAVGKYIPTGVTITFQFADGTYTLNDSLDFPGFYGGGTLNIFGNTGEANATALHTTQAVILDFKGNSVNGIQSFENNTIVNIRNLRCEVDNTHIACFLQNSSFRNNVEYNSFRVNGSGGTGTSVGVQNSTCWLRNNYVTGGAFGVYSTITSGVSSITNDDISTLPLYGLRSSNSVIYKFSATQPAGSTANELLTHGGQIF